MTVATTTSPAPAGSPLAQQIASFGRELPPERFAIDPRDEMLEFLVDVYGGDPEQARCGYFRSGHSIAATLAAILAWRFGPAAAPAVLDFASGYGRVTRFLLSAVPAQRLWVSDVLAEAVAAQREAFGVGGFASTLRPEDLAAPRRFDAVTVTSLFTHLPEARFGDWLAALWRLLAPGGMLVFSTHDSALHPDPARRGRDFVFERVSESRSLEIDDYGTTWVSEPFVRAAVSAVAGDAAAHRLPRALCNFQDLWVVVPEPSAPFATLELPADPEVTVETCELAAGELRLDGWAMSRHGRVETVEISLDGKPLGRAPLATDRDDIAMALGAQHRRSGWAWRGAASVASPATAVVGLTAVTADGERRQVWVGSLQLLQLQTKSLLATCQREELFRLAEELAATRAQAAAEREGLRARIAAMEASRFWKLRNRWFAAKRALGLTRET